MDSNYTAVIGLAVTIYNNINQIFYLKWRSFSAFRSCIQKPLLINQSMNKSLADELVD